MIKEVREQRRGQPKRAKDPPRRHGWKQLGQLVRLDLGIGLGTDLRRVTAGTEVDQDDHHHDDSDGNDDDDYRIISGDMSPETMR